MTDQPPKSPFTLTPARITILILGALAAIFIVGGLMGGVANYQKLRESTTSDFAPSSSVPSPYSPSPESIIVP